MLEGLLLDLRQAGALPQDPVPLGGREPDLLPGGPTRAQVRQVPQGHAQLAAHEGRVHQLRVEGDLRHPEGQAVHEHPLRLPHGTQVEQDVDLLEEDRQGRLAGPAETQETQDRQAEQGPVARRVEHQERAGHGQEAAEGEVQDVHQPRVEGPVLLGEVWQRAAEQLVEAPLAEQDPDEGRQGQQDVQAAGAEEVRQGGAGVVVHRLPRLLVALELELRHRARVLQLTEAAAPGLEGGQERIAQGALGRLAGGEVDVRDGEARLLLLPLEGLAQLAQAIQLPRGLGGLAQLGQDRADELGQLLDQIELGLLGAALEGAQVDARGDRLEVEGEAVDLRLQLADLLELLEPQLAVDRRVVGGPQVPQLGSLGLEGVVQGGEGLEGALLVRRQRGADRGRRLGGEVRGPGIPSALDRTEGGGRGDQRQRRQQGRQALEGTAGEGAGRHARMMGRALGDCEPVTPARPGVRGLQSRRNLSPFVQTSGSRPFARLVSHGANPGRRRRSEAAGLRA